MKKLFVTAIALVSVGFAQAQTVKFGAKAGLNLSTLNGDAVADDVKMKPGFHAGALAEIKFTDMIALQPEVLFSLQGAKTSDTFDNGFGTVTTTESKWNLGYINVPVMFKLYPVKGFYIEAGPQAGFLISAKSKDETRVTTGGTVTTSSETVDIKDNLKTFDFTFNAGLGYDFTEHFYAGARYGFGLTNIYDAPSVFGLGVTEFDVKNGNLQVSVGYKF